MTGYFSSQELRDIGFGSVGENVWVSKHATIYNVSSIFIGNNVRIDNFCVIAMSGSAQLKIGNCVHISAFNFINGMGDVQLGDYFTTAPYVRIFSSSDDYTGKHMTNSMVPKRLIGTISKPVIIEKHVIIGVGSTILQGVTLAEGTAIAGHSFVNQDTSAFTIVGGVPAKKIKDRFKDLLYLENEINL